MSCQRPWIWVRVNLDPSIHPRGLKNLPISLGALVGFIRKGPPSCSGFSLPQLSNGTLQCRRLFPSPELDGFGQLVSGANTRSMAVCRSRSGDSVVRSFATASRTSGFRTRAKSSEKELSLERRIRERERFSGITEQRKDAVVHVMGVGPGPPSRLLLT